MNSNYYLLIYCAFFISAIIFSLLINGLFLRFAKTLGMRNTDDGTIIRWGGQSKPTLGGISFYILFLLSIVTYSIFFDFNQAFLNKQFLGVVLAVSLGFLMGLSDDAYNTKPLLKFSVQLACSVVAIFSGIYIHVSSFMLLNYFITAIWIIGIMNSINMLDNMDAITSTVSINIILSAILLMIIRESYTNVHFIILLGVLSALIGFLYFNWYPSKIYMGDTGSQFLGVYLALIGIIYFWNNESPTLDLFHRLKQFIIPILIFIMPLIDTTIVVINRLAKKKSPFIGGKDHTTHNLVYHVGLSDRNVAWIFSIISLMSVFFAILIVNYITWNFFYTLLFTFYILIVFALFFYISKIKKKLRTI